MTASLAARRVPPTVEQWRAEFASIVEAKVNCAIRLAASEPAADYEATILRLMDWRATLSRRAS